MGLKEDAVPALRNAVAALSAGNWVPADDV
jgi:hypothetical protein